MCLSFHLRMAASVVEVLPISGTTERMFSTAGNIVEVPSTTITVVKMFSAVEDEVAMISITEGRLGLSALRVVGLAALQAFLMLLKTQMIILILDCRLMPFGQSSRNY